MTFLLRFSFFGSLSKDQWGLDDFWRISCEILEYPLGFVSVFFQILVRDPFGFSHEPSRSCFARARCLGEEKTTRALGGILSILKRRLNHPRMMNHFLLISESMIYLTDGGGEWIERLNPDERVRFLIRSDESETEPRWNLTEVIGIMDWKWTGNWWNVAARQWSYAILIPSVCLSVCLSVC